MVQGSDERICFPSQLLSSVNQHLLRSNRYFSHTLSRLSFSSRQALLAIADPTQALEVPT